MYWYHKETKHSYYSIRTNPNQMDWRNQPSTYKNYPPSYLKIEIQKNHPWHSIIYYASSISDEKFYPPSTHYYLRCNPSAGALYPNELYFQARDIEGFKNGIYHYEVRTNSATLLHSLEGDEGLEPYMGYGCAMKGLLFLISAVYYRSSWKYKDRAFRYCLLDAGHLLGSLEHSAFLEGNHAAVVYDIERKTLNTIFGFENREFFLAGLSVSEPIKTQTVSKVNFTLAYVEASNSFEQNEMIEIAYRQTSHLVKKKSECNAPLFNYGKEQLQDIITSRRSQRGFEGQPISKDHYQIIMDAIMQPILSDCDEAVDIFVVLNKVYDMPFGVYLNTRLLRNEELSQKAGYLCLEQYTLATAGAMTFFLVSNAKNYQALYQKAGIIGQRLYMISNYLGLGCSGIGAYYDDEVNTFVEKEGSVLYALAIGK